MDQETLNFFHWFLEMFVHFLLKTFQLFMLTECGIGGDCIEA